jgi:hypothetical protein
MHRASLRCFWGTRRLRLASDRRECETNHHSYRRDFYHLGFLQCADARRSIGNVRRFMTLGAASNETSTH